MRCTDLLMRKLHQRFCSPRDGRCRARAVVWLTAVLLAAASSVVVAKAEPPLAGVAPQDVETPNAAGPASAPAPAPEMAPVAASTEDAAMSAFLDRLMLVESGGRDDARNPRSTAVGPFQFIESTFLDVARRHFAAETTALAAPQILALRTNRIFARRAAVAFTRDNADILFKNALPSTPANLRLAFLVGPNAAVRLLKAEVATPVITILGTNVVQANPFMAGMTVRDLAGWSERSISGGRGVAATEIKPRTGVEQVEASIRPLPLVAVPVAPPPCNVDLPSCRKWIALNNNRALKRVAAVAPRRGGLR